MAASSSNSSHAATTSKDKGKQKAVQSDTSTTHGDLQQTAAAATVVAPRVPPMPNPSAGSANPSASLASLWNYLEPALDHIVRSPTNHPDPDRAPAIDVAYHMGIHTAVYNYFTSVGRFGVDALAAPRQISSKGLGIGVGAGAGAGDSSGSGAVGVLTNGSGAGAGTTRPSTSPPGGNPHGAELYDKLDKYYSEVCQELLASAPVDDSSLLPYLLPVYKRYHAGASSVHRLLNYVNRHYVKRAVEEDRGWLRLTDILDAVVQAIEENQPREQLAARLRERRLAELRRWGYVEGEGATTEDLARAEAAAEAASPPDRVVPLSSMAHRRFREEVIKPLLAVPKVKKSSGGGGGGKKKYKKPPNPNPNPNPNTSSSSPSPSSATANSPDGGGENANGPKSRLARAVKELIESKDSSDSGPVSASASASESVRSSSRTPTLEERREMAAELNDMLGTVGIPIDHVLRKKLDKFLLLRTPKGKG